MGLLEDGRRYLVKKAPFFAPLAFGHRYIADARVGTIGVTPSLLVLYNPAFLEPLSYAEVGALLFHEMMHVVTTFPLESVLGPSANKHVLNLAADCHINEVGRQEGWILPAGVLYPETYGLPPGLSTLEYYRLLMQNPPPSSEEGHICKGECGVPEELAREYAEQGVDTPRKKEVLRQFAEEASRTPGRLRGDIDTLLPFVQAAASEIHWPDHLRSSLLSEITRMRGLDAYTYSRPHKRSFLGEDVLLPGGVSERKEVSIIIDTSGSMGPDLLRASLREAAEVLSSLGQETCLLYQADTRLQSRQEVAVEDLSDASFKVRGRGGTSFRYPVQEIVGSGDPVGALVYLTDGYGDDPGPTPFPIIWGIFTDAPPPGQGVVVRIKP